ncbi:MAG: glycoside hydrolase family 88 protein [Prevotella sp.]|nr:glycoside hydrolase family 88 protein [Prevotella sp.]
MNKTFKTVLLIMLCTIAWHDAQAVTFDESTAYSKLIINSRLHDFYANKTHMGLALYDASGRQTAEAYSVKFDYVPGLVAKAVLEAAEYYSATDAETARTWYYSIENYANAYYGSVPTGGGSLDDLNAAKIYGMLFDLANGVFAPVANDKTPANCLQGLTRAAQGLKAHADNYSIAASTLSDAAGGWYHKQSYVNQMWLDGQYMGPVLLAQILALNARDKGTDLVPLAFSDAWKTIVRQFDITWKYLWNEETGLLYHAFSATPTASSSAAAWGRAGVYHSAEYWGRAEGWYFFALVDLLEYMQQAGLSESDDYARLRGYVNKLAAGLAARQDAATGCWYQLLNYDGTFYADRYKNKRYEPVYNYLESSASAIFIACYLKGHRLGLFDADYTALARKAYQGYVQQFLVDDGDNGLHICNSCRSAGLCGSSNRDGSAAYYLLGSDVTRVTASMKQTEGKALGAFILAAVEYERQGTTAILHPRVSDDNSLPARKFAREGHVVIQSDKDEYVL